MEQHYNTEEEGTPVSPLFAEHRASYVLRKPDLSKQEYEDEIHLITPEEGIFEMTFPSGKDVLCGAAPRAASDITSSNISKYLWAIAQNSVPVSLENSQHAKALERGRLAHTNLTGGCEAHTAGELWFVDCETIIINGGSSRYTPRSPDELESVAKAFKKSGYKVASMGFEGGIPVRMLRGEPEWIT